jgi:hypothetical protein
MGHDTETVYTYRGITKAVELAYANDDFDSYVQDFAIIIDGLFRFMAWPDDKWSFVSTVENALRGTTDHVEADASKRFATIGKHIVCAVLVKAGDDTQTIVKMRIPVLNTSYNLGDPISILLTQLAPIPATVNNGSSCLEFYKVMADIIRDQLCDAAKARGKTQRP